MPFLLLQLSKNLQQLFMPQHALFVICLLAQYVPELQPILKVQHFPHLNPCGLLLLVLNPPLLLRHNIPQNIHFNSHTVLFLSDILRGQHRYQLLLFIIQEPLLEQIPSFYKSQAIQKHTITFLDPLFLQVFVLALIEFFKHVLSRHDCGDF